MSRTDPQLNIRLSSELLELLRTASVSNHRSLTAEVAHRLASTFTHDDRDGVRQKEVSKVVAVHQVIGPNDDHWQNSLIQIAVTDDGRVFERDTFGGPKYFDWHETDRIPLDQLPGEAS